MSRYGREYRSSSRGRARHWGREGAPRPRGAATTEWPRWWGAPAGYAEQYGPPVPGFARDREPLREVGGYNVRSTSTLRWGGRAGYLALPPHDYRAESPGSPAESGGPAARVGRYSSNYMRSGGSEARHRDPGRHPGHFSGYAPQRRWGPVEDLDRRAGPYGREYAMRETRSMRPGDYVRELPGSDRVRYGHTPSDRWPELGHQLEEARTERWSDDDICDIVCENLYRDTWVDPAQIQVSVDDGVVTLRGEVADFMEARYVWDDAWEAPGVRGVINHLTVRTDMPSDEAVLPQTSGRGERR